MLTPFDFKPSFYCTQEFDTWWKAYHTREFSNVATLTRYLTNVFSSLQQKFNKGKAKHVKEIQAFHKYFEIVYNPNDLSRTIREVFVTLKEKMMVRLTNLRILDYVKDKYTFALNFYPPKFPPLPTSSMALAFAPPFPRRFICG